MRKISLLCLFFLYLEIFSGQTTGLNLDLHICEFSNTECYTTWEKANWTNANTTCVQNKGKIISVPGYLIGKIVQTNYGGKYYWTDYGSVNNSERFRSVEGNYLPDSFPHYGNENYSLNGNNCVAFDVERREFLSLDCNSENVVVCETGHEECDARSQEYQKICLSSALTSPVPSKSSLSNLTLDFNLTTNDRVHIYSYSQAVYTETVIFQLTANTQTEVLTHGGDIQIQANITNEDTKCVFLSSFLVGRKRNRITIYTKEDSTRNLSIFFDDYYYINKTNLTCVHWKSDEYWSPEGLTTHYNISRGKVQCITNFANLTVVEVYGLGDVNFETDFITIFTESQTSSIRFDCHDSHSYCYTTSIEQNTWANATKQTCDELGGRMVDSEYYKNGWFNNGINMLFQTKERPSCYWIGLRRVDNTSVFEWTDGRRIYLYNWKSENPKKGVNCVGIERKSGMLVSLDCKSKNNVICEIDSKNCTNPQERDIRELCSAPIFTSGIPTESSLKNLSLNVNLTIGSIMEFYHYPQEMFVTRVNATSTTEMQIGANLIQLETDTFKDPTTLIYSISYSREYQFINFRLTRDILTVYTGHNSSAHLVIIFNNFSNNATDGCVRLEKDGKWTTEGMETFFCPTNRTIRCTTELQNIGTYSVNTSYFSPLSEVFDDNFIEGVLSNINFVSSIGIILFISVLFLLSSVVIFIFSGKEFFSHDINILHFYNTIALFLAIICAPLLIPGLTFFKKTPKCITLSLFLHFLWTNVFLSSLSIAIVVFYSIWIVSIKHTARKLYKFLIPIGWFISLLWASMTIVIKYFNVSYCESENRCLLKTPFKLDIGWEFLGIMIAILIVNTIILLLSLFKIWLVLKRKSIQGGELKRLRKVAISGILLIPSLSLPFISFIGIELSSAPTYYNAKNLQNYLPIILSVFLINSPIGIIHFIVITCQIKETIFRRYCCKHRITPARVARSLRLNIIRKKLSNKARNTEKKSTTKSVQAIQAPVYLNNFVEPNN